MDIPKSFKEDYNNLPYKTLMEKYNISKQTIANWRKKLNLPYKQKERNIGLHKQDLQKIEIAKFGRTNGFTHTCLQYPKVDKKEIKRIFKEYSIPISFSEKIPHNFLRYIEIYGVKETARKLNVSVSTVYLWRRKLKGSSRAYRKSK
ncbi:hypothetical protein [Oceanotoga phage vB_OteS-UFV02]